MIDQVFQHGAIKLFLTHQVQQNTWIEIAAARAHNRPAGGRQTHAGVDRLAAFDGSDAGAIAKVRDDHTLGQCLAQAVHDGFTRQAVKPVAVDALQLQLSGNWQHAGHVWQSGMKTGVEARRLWQGGEVFLCGADDRKRDGCVQWREGSSGFKLPQYRVINQAMLMQRRAAVHHAMAYCPGCGQFVFGQKACNAGHCFFRVGRGN